MCIQDLSESTAGYYCKHRGLTGSAVGLLPRWI